MEKKQDYIPGECIRTARDFVKTLGEDVEIYRQLRTLHLTGDNEEAEKFVAYFYMGSYMKYPHALIMIYEARSRIDEAFGPHDAQNVTEFLNYRMYSYYRLLKDNGMIDD
jgi:hypothetical protein